MKTWKCNFCNTEVIINKPSSKSIHLRYCKEFKKFKKEKLTKSFLYEEYIEKGKSAKEIASEYGLSSATSIIKLLKYHNIQTRNISESKTQDRYKEKYEETMLERYGVKHNLERGSPIRKQMEIDLLKKYGVSNVFQLDEVKEKIKETCLANYGFEYAMQNDEVKERVWNSTYKNHGVKYGIIKAHHNIKSKPQRRIEEILESDNIEYISEYKIYPYYVDILCSKSKKVIEVYGDFWHANPIKYKKDDILNFPYGKKMLVEDKWNYDKERINHIKLQGFEILIIWENDIYKNLQYVEKSIWNYLRLRK